MKRRGTMKKTIDCADPNVICPFYILEEKLKIRCEGYCKGTSIHIRFDSMDQKRGHKRKYCKDIKCYTSCPLYPVIMKQYEEDDGE
jgi:hypothetical protein